MARSTVRNKGQVTIPAGIREAFAIGEGTIVEFTATDEGVLMKPKVEVLVDPADAWFYSDAWQARHREAVEELERGAGETHPSSDDFIAALDRD